MEPDQAIPRISAATYICDEDFEHTMAQLLQPVEHGTRPESLAPIQDEAVIEVSSLLELHGDKFWCQRPRTYILLYLIHQRESLTVFETQTDYSLPYSQATLPTGLKVPGVRRQFLEYQSMVLSLDAKVVQTPDQEHKHFQNTGDTHFAPLQELGHGGFGVVDKFWARLSNRAYARKRFYKGKNCNQGVKMAKNFENELRTLKKLSHYHLVKYVGSYTDPEYLALIMLPVADCDLHFWLEHEPDLPSLRRSFGCLSSVMAYLHREHVRHKDIKPKNILVQQGTIFLTDFGTALDWSELDQSTTSGVPVGITFRYAALEVLEHGKRGSSSDIFSLGCVFLEMATRLHGTPLRTLHQHLEGSGTGNGLFARNEPAVQSWIEFLSPAGVPEVESRILNVTMKMLNSKRNSRPSAKELLELVFGTDPNLICNHCKQENGLFGLPSSSPMSAIDMMMNETTEPHPANGTTKSPKSKLPPVSTPEVVEVQEEIRNMPVHEQHPSQVPALLCAAAKDRNLPLVRTLAAITQSIDYLDADGYTALMRAACHDDAPVARTLLEHNADPRISGKFDHNGDNKGQTVLDLAVESGSTEVLKALVFHSRSKNLSIDIDKALFRAILKNVPNAVNTLLELEADPNTFQEFQNTKISALCAAVLHSCWAISVALVNHGATLATSKGNFIAHTAIERGSRSILRCLIEYKLPIDGVDDSGSTALHLAVAKGEKDLVDLLLEAGADPNATNPKGSTALFIAAKHGHTGLIASLVSKGGNPEFRNSDGDNAASIAACYGKDKFLETLLDQFGARSYRNLRGWSPLHNAVRSGHEAVVDLLLLKTPGDLFHKTKRSQTTPLTMAVSYSHRRIARKLLAQDPKQIDEKDSDGRPPLFCAIDLGKESQAKAMMKILLDGAPSAISSRDNLMMTPLMFACSKDKPEMVQILLSRGAYVADSSKSGAAALSFAAYAGSDACIKLLLTHGASVDAMDTVGYTALTWAAMNNKHDTVVFLKDSAKSDINCRSRSYTQLMTASYNGALVGVQLLLRAGAAMDLEDQDGRTALHLAILTGHPKVAQALLENGCEADSKTGRDDNAIMLASQLGRSKIVKQLITRGVSLNERTAAGDTALILAIHKGHAEVALALLEKGCEANSKGSKNMNPIMLASQLGHFEIVRHLIVRGVSLEERTVDGDSALLLAIGEGHSEVARILLEQGCEANAKNLKDTNPIMLASQLGNVDVVRHLIARGVPLEEQTVAGNTALSKAVDKGHLEVSKLLVDSGADKEVKGGGFTPLYRAAYRGHKEIAEMLVRAGADVERAMDGAKGSATRQVRDALKLLCEVGDLAPERSSPRPRAPSRVWMYITGT